MLKNYLRKHLFRDHRQPADFLEVERAERIFYLKYLREGMTVLDVGANIGELTLLFSRFAGQNGVHSFEASSSAFKKLRTVCEAAERRGVTLNPLALSDEKGSIRLYIYEDALSSFNSQARRPLKDYGLDFEPVGIEDVPAITVDEYCESKRIESIDLLKIDVEGAEFQVMKGAHKMLKAKKISCIVFEFGQTTFDMGNDPVEIENFLCGYGYNIQNIVDGDPVFPGRERVESAKYSMHIAVPA